MNYFFHPDAEKEFLFSIDYYEQIEKGLGVEFAIEIYSTIKRIMTFPKAWTIVENNIHRSLVKRFPFGILYSVKNENIIILAVMHLKKKPEYWKKRIKK